MQAFDRGIINDDLKYYDFTSAYPAVMRDLSHPVGKQYVTTRELTDETDFVPKASGTLQVTGHELRAALKLGRAGIKRIVYAKTCSEKLCFKDFIDRFFTLREQAKRDEDPMRDLFYKLVMNSAYGRFALNPSKFSDECITDKGDAPDDFDGACQCRVT